MNHRGRSYRFGPRRPMIVAGWRSYGSTAAGRALEDRRAWNDAVAVLQEALKLEPDSIAVARRLCRIYIGAIGPARIWLLNTASGCWRPSPVTARRSVSWWSTTVGTTRPGLMSILNEVLANPKLEQHAFGRLLAQYELGRLYSGRLHQTDKAADAFAKVLEGLDDKSANRLTPVDQCSASWATTRRRLISISPWFSSRRSGMSWR